MHSRLSLYGLFRKKLKHYNKDVKYSRVTGSFAGVGGGGTAGMITFGTIMGGAGAALTGGNFWQGAVMGCFSFLFNGQG